MKRTYVRDCAPEPHVAEHGAQLPTTYLPQTSGAYYTYCGRYPIRARNCCEQRRTKHRIANEAEERLH